MTRSAQGERLRIVVGGFIGLMPAGGVTWDYVQYPLGLAEMGHDVFYVEDTRLWPIYHEMSGRTADGSDNAAHVARVMEAFGFAGRWAYRDEMSGQCFGMSSAQVREVCRTADVLVNVSCSTAMREEYERIPARMLIDTDPMFTQIQFVSGRGVSEAPESGMRGLMRAHNHFFTFGENMGAPDCRIPDCGVRWITTRQPICLSQWTPQPLRDSNASYTTVMNWAVSRDLEFEGELWGQKNIEFMRVIDLPQSAPSTALSVAVSQSSGTDNEGFPVALARAAGWQVLDPARIAPDWESYRHFISASAGEFSVAKHTYVKARTGWFSCRSACYLAAGRPVVTQDTGWSSHLPTGDGLFAFSDTEGAAESLRAIAREPARHQVAARRIAEEHFDARKVLGKLLADAGA